MQPFESVTFEYKGKTYTVKPENIWGLISTIETVISRLKLAMRIASNDIPETKVAEAYAAALQYAGAGRVDPREVLYEMGFHDIMRTAQLLFGIMSMAVKPVSISDKEVSKGQGDNSPKETTTEV